MDKQVMDQSSAATRFAQTILKPDSAFFQPVVELLNLVDCENLQVDDVEQIANVAIKFVPQAFSQMLRLCDEVGFDCSLREGFPEAECVHQLIGFVTYAGLTELCREYLWQRVNADKLRGGNVEAPR
jgi:hypothetical protein